MSPASPTPKDNVESGTDHASKLTDLIPLYAPHPHFLRPVLTSTHFSMLDLIWDDQHLAAYLADPRRYIPATKMVFCGLKKPEERADLIAYLNDPR